ncbi:MAG: hypothetical protein ACI83Y_001194 [Candidatus Azotimanducaceae bacterium]|jgi:hypothetical protein
MTGQVVPGAIGLVDGDARVFAAVFGVHGDHLVRPTCGLFGVAGSGKKVRRADRRMCLVDLA